MIIKIYLILIGTLLILRTAAYIRISKIIILAESKKIRQAAEDFEVWPAVIPILIKIIGRYKYVYDWDQ